MNYMLKPKNIANRRQLGLQYEEMARHYLVTQGYTILEHNFHSRFGEIDIIAKQGAYIVFIEVKYRRTKQFGYPREAVTYRKQMHIKKVAAYFLLTHVGKEAPCRFDVIEILDQRLTHIKAAF